MQIRSMTGYGKGICERDDQRVTIELKSVNHRFLDLSMKLPKQFLFAEDLLRKTIKERAVRGHIDVFVSYEDRRADRVSLDCDRALVARLRALSVELAEQYGYADTLGTAEVMRLPDVLITRAEETDENALSDMLVQACNAALDSLDVMRTKEGALLAADLLAKCETVRTTVDAICLVAPDTVVQHREKVRKRIEEFLQGTEVDEARLLNEIAFYSDKVCIDEETTRLYTHTEHFADKIRAGGAVGKQLDFLIQEMNRESNTIASKCSDIRVSEHAVALKSVIEMMREQIQNVE